MSRRPKPRIFVAGATGVIGRRLVPLLVDRGHDVTAMTRHAASVPLLRSTGASPVVADALDGHAVRTALAQARPDVVIHQMTDLRDGDSQANAHLRTVGSRHLVDAARAAGVTRVIGQSIAWAYEPGSGPS